MQTSLIASWPASHQNPAKNALMWQRARAGRRRLLKARGADVTGVDIGVGVIEAAKKLAPDIDFRVGDAEELDFPDSGFDVVTSTFGVMFVARPEDAARELARVCRKGGRLGLCTWLPGGTIEGLFQVMRPYMPPPSANPPPSPFEWGKPSGPLRLAIVEGLDVSDSRLGPPAPKDFGPHFDFRSQ